MGKHIFGPQELVCRPYMPVFLGWTVRNTDTLLKIRPVGFRGLSGALLRFSPITYRRRINSCIVWDQ